MGKARKTGRVCRPCAVRPVGGGGGGELDVAPSKKAMYMYLGPKKAEAVDVIEDVQWLQGASALKDIMKPNHFYLVIDDNKESITDLYFFISSQLSVRGYSYYADNLTKEGGSFSKIIPKKEISDVRNKKNAIQVSKKNIAKAKEWVAEFLFQKFMQNRHLSYDRLVFLYGVIKNNFKAASEIDDRITDIVTKSASSSLQALYDRVVRSYDVMTKTVKDHPLNELEDKIKDIIYTSYANECNFVQYDLKFEDICGKTINPILQSIELEVTQYDSRYTDLMHEVKGEKKIQTLKRETFYIYSDEIIFKFTEISSDKSQFVFDKIMKKVDGEEGVNYEHETEYNKEEVLTMMHDGKLEPVTTSNFDTYQWAVVPYVVKKCFDDRRIKSIQTQVTAKVGILQHMDKQQTLNEIVSDLEPHTISIPEEKVPGLNGEIQAIIDTFGNVDEESHRATDLYCSQLKTVITETRKLFEIDSGEEPLVYDNIIHAILLHLQQLDAYLVNKTDNINSRLQQFRSDTVKSYLPDSGGGESGEDVDRGDTGDSDVVEDENGLLGFRSSDLPSGLGAATPVRGDDVFNTPEGSENGGDEDVDGGVEVGEGAGEGSGGAVMGVDGAGDGSGGAVLGVDGAGDGSGGAVLGVDGAGDGSGGAVLGVDGAGDGSGGAVLGNNNDTAAAKAAEISATESAATRANRYAAAAKDAATILTNANSKIQQFVIKHPDNVDLQTILTAAAEIVRSVSKNVDNCNQYARQARDAVQAAMKSSSVSDARAQKVIALDLEHDTDEAKVAVDADTAIVLRYSELASAVSETLTFCIASEEDARLANDILNRTIDNADAVITDKDVGETVEAVKVLASAASDAANNADTAQRQIRHIVTNIREENTEQDLTNAISLVRAQKETCKTAAALAAEKRASTAAASELVEAAVIAAKIKSSLVYEDASEDKDKPGPSSTLPGEAMAVPLKQYSGNVEDYEPMTSAEMIGIYGKKGNVNSPKQYLNMTIAEQAESKKKLWFYRQELCEIKEFINPTQKNKNKSVQVKTQLLNATGDKTFAASQFCLAKKKYISGQSLSTPAAGVSGAADSLTNQLAKISKTDGATFAIPDVETPGKNIEPSTDHFNPAFASTEILSRTTKDEALANYRKCIPYIREFIEWHNKKKPNEYKTDYIGNEQEAFANLQNDIWIVLFKYGPPGQEKIVGFAQCQRLVEDNLGQTMNLDKVWIRQDPTVRIPGMGRYFCIEAIKDVLKAQTPSGKRFSKIHAMVIYNNPGALMFFYKTLNMFFNLSKDAIAGVSRFSGGTVGDLSDNEKKVVFGIADAVLNGLNSDQKRKLFDKYEQTPEQITKLMENSDGKLSRYCFESITYGITKNMESGCDFNIAVDIESFDDSKNTIKFKSSWKNDFDKLSDCLQSFKADASNSTNLKEIISILCNKNAKSFRKSVQDIVLDAEDVSEKIPEGFKEEWSLLSQRLTKLAKEIKPAV